MRLADFGQARRASESGPSLGTLFYMAPEQGDADSRPDVRADVYALGALAYTMLTGRAPYANATASEHLASSGTTAERVQRYRKLIDESPAPRDHRRVSGIDRTFADIVDRCLEKDPVRWFESVPRVLAALDARERQRARRPLVLLGIIGPIAVALLLGGVGVWARNRALGDATTAVTAQTLENVAGYSTLVATVVDRNLSASRRQVEHLVPEPDARGVPVRIPLRLPRVPRIPRSGHCRTSATRMSSTSTRRSSSSCYWLASGSWRSRFQPTTATRSAGSTA